MYITFFLVCRYNFSMIAGVKWKKIYINITNAIIAIFLIASVRNGSLNIFSKLFLQDWVIFVVSFLCVHIGSRISNGKHNWEIDNREQSLRGNKWIENLIWNTKLSFSFLIFSSNSPLYFGLCFCLSSRRDRGYCKRSKDTDNMEMFLWKMFLFPRKNVLPIAILWRVQLRQ